MNTIYHQIKLMGAALLCMGMTSCLNFEPEAQMSDTQTWNSATNFQLFANQFYGYTRDFCTSATTYDYCNATKDGPHSDTRSDLMAESSVNTYSAGTNSIPETDGNYSTLYKRIYYCNLLLKHAAGYANSVEIATPVAEAKFFRAYLYFELVQIYGNCILLTEPIDLDSEKLTAQRDDRGSVIDQIIKDLQESAAALPATPSERGRLCADAAYAMLSRVALYEGTWQKFHTNGSETTTNTDRSTALLTIARNAAKKVMTDGNFSLFYSAALGTDSYRYMFILEDATCNPAGLTTTANTEYILPRRHRIEDGIKTNITKAYLANAVYPTRKLANMYLCQDGLPVSKSTQFKGYTGATTEFENRDNRMLTTLMPHGTLYWNNTTNNCRTAWTTDDQSRALTCNARSNSGYQTHKWGVERFVKDTYEAMDYPVIRYAEVLLNYAEATYELDGSISDDDLNASLNLVRARSNPDMVKLSNTLVTANSLNMREEIRRERTIELAFEGFRIDDLKRWATAPTEMPQDLLGVKYTGTWFENNWTSQSRSLNADGCIVLYSNRVWNDKLYLYPIPSDQLQLDPNLGQNPGWE